MNMELTFTGTGNGTVDIAVPLSCKPKPKKDKNGKITKRPRSSGSTRDDAPNYDKPIYDRSGNQIGVIYDPPPMGGPSGLS
jgi:hypothetical protein